MEEPGSILPALDQLRKIDPVFSVVAVITGIVIWVYSTFATISYVKEMHTEAINHSDVNRERMMGVLLEIKETVRTIDARTWEIEKSRKEGRSK